MVRPTEIKNQYDTWHSKIHGHESPNKIILDGWHRNAFAAYDDVKDKKILEVGCGVGDFSIFLQNNGGITTGVDFSNSAIELAKIKSESQGNNAKFLVADAQNLPFDSESFDLIYSCECLEHIPSPQKAIEEFYRVLKPSGKLILTTENYSNPLILLWIRSWITKKPFDSGGGAVQPIENFFLFWKVKKMFKKAGFKILKIDSWHFIFLILPKFHPHAFVANQLKNKFLKNLFKPLGRHFTYLLEK